MLGLSTPTSIRNFLSTSEFYYHGEQDTGTVGQAGTVHTPNGVIDSNPYHRIDIYLSFYRGGYVAEQLATILLHEMWHFRGGGADVDSDKNRATLLKNCGTADVPKR